MFLNPVVNLLQTIVSKKKAVEETVSAIGWDELEDAYENQEIVMGYLDHRVERGYIIRFGEVRGFAPRYRFDLCEYDEIPEIFLNQPLPFIILSIDYSNDHLVVSRIDAIQQLQADYLNSLTKNQVVEAQVTMVMPNLVTLNLSGMTCLVARNELSWNDFGHPSELVSIGDWLSVKLLKVVPGKAYITASLKQLDSTCWQRFTDNFSEGSEVPVVITNVTDFGYFVSYRGEISGILHWSEVSWGARSRQQAMQYEKGDALRVKVSALDFDKQQVSFSLKAMQPDPADQACSSYQIGDVVEGVVRSRTDFGVFLEIAENFNGLLHFSNLSWYTNSKNNLVNFRSGMFLKAKIVEVDKSNGRVGLGLRQLYENPFEVQPSPHSLLKSESFPRPVSIGVTSFFQANCHNQIVAQLDDMRHKMRQHVDLTIDNLFFETHDVILPEIMLVLLSDDYLSSEGHQILLELLATHTGVKPLVIPIVVDSIAAGREDPLLEIACLPVDRSPPQQWRVKSAYWSTVNKSLIKAVRYVAGLK